MKPLLSILIPTTEGRLDRRELLGRLLDRLRPQLSDAVVIRKLVDDGRMLVGTKRQKLLVESTTPWVTFIDDDDLVSPDYCDRVLAAIETGADVVGFRLSYFDDGTFAGEGIHSVRCDHWKTVKRDDGFQLFDRMPNHLNPIRREIALSVGYKPLSAGEDADYSRRLREKHPAMKEHFIDAFMYEYWHRNKPPQPREPAWDVQGRLTREGAEQAILNGGSAWFDGKHCTRLDQLDAGVLG